MITENYQVKLENIFEGPMDLLVYLIRKNDVDIYDIPISLITDQYLAYLDWMKSMSIDLAGEFLVMAATLAQIKSRMLLPASTDAEEADDPRMEIARPLLEYLEIKSAAELLARRTILGEDTFIRSVGKRLEPNASENDTIEVGLFELIEAFQRILEKHSSGHDVDLSYDRMSVNERIEQLLEILEEKGTVTFQELFSEGSSAQEIVLTFLAILEMVRLSLIRVSQSEETGIIRLFYI